MVFTRFLHCILDDDWRISQRCESLGDEFKKKIEFVQSPIVDFHQPNSIYKLDFCASNAETYLWPDT